MRFIMNKIEALKIRKMIKELDFIKEEYNYVHEVVNNSDGDFMKAIDEILELHPDMKKIYDERLNSKLNEAIEKAEEEINDAVDDAVDDADDDAVKIVKNDKIKTIYRSIAKKTHPDKVSDGKMNRVYIEASKSYKENNIIDLYRYCDILDIPYEIDGDDKKQIQDNINDYKEKTSFLESTFTWKWFNENDPEVKNNIIMTFIKMKIR
jgi:hypothetical protein